MKLAPTVVTETGGARLREGPASDQEAPSDGRPADTRCSRGSEWSPKGLTGVTSLPVDPDPVDPDYFGNGLAATTMKECNVGTDTVQRTGAAK